MKRLLSALCVILMFVGCQKEPEETNTKGNLHVRVPESIAPVMIEEIKAFSDLYKESGANVTYSITTSEEAMKEFFRDTLRLCFSTIPFPEEQMQKAKEISPDINTTLFAYDAIVFITNENNSLRQITTDEVKRIFDGKISRWEQLKNSKQKGDLFVSLQDSGDVIAYFRSLYKTEDFKIKNWQRAKSEEEVLNFTRANVRTLGIVPLSWYKKSSEGFSMLEVAPTRSESDTLFAVAPEAIGKYFSPHPAYLYLRYYPFYRRLYVCCRTLYGNVAAGFTTFVTHSEGQKIILDNALLPGTQKIVLKQQ